MPSSYVNSESIASVVYCQRINTVARYNPVWYGWGMEKIRPLVELAAYRKNAGISQQAFANSLSPPVKAITVYRWESGRRRPAREYLVQLNRITGVSLFTLMGLEL